MTAPEKPENEDVRLAEVQALEFNFSEADERFERIARLAKRLFDVPSAVITIIGDDVRWTLAPHEHWTQAKSRDESFCAHTILGEGILQVFDASKDSRFLDNPYVVGEPHIRFYAGYPIRGPQGSNLGGICVFDELPRVLTEEENSHLRDLALMVEQEIATRQLAATDELTLLANRREFDLSGALLLDLCHKGGLGAVLVFLDLDGFKLINDKFGHAEGDHALVEFAQLLQSSFRSSDIVARYGGDEFVVLLADTQDASLAIGRLTASLAHRNDDPTATYEIEASVGVALMRAGSSEPLAKLVERADSAMYEDKLRRHARPR
jgi:diguanylate cyclase (GGDEF)-like protein